jgi:hypothetical protein
MYPKIYTDLFREFARKPEVFVAMPFSKAFEARWKFVFKPAICSFNLKPYRVKERYVAESIPIDILHGINRSRFLLVDISNEETGHPNPNVMYELGIAHATRLPEEVIIIRDDKSETVPFDIKHIRWNEFFPQKVGQSIAKIKKLLKSAEREVNFAKDEMIEKTLNFLDPETIEFLEIIKDFYEEIGEKYIKNGFDLYPFDPDRKGLYGLISRECSEEYLRQIARNLVHIEILRSASPLPPHKRIYGGTPEYYLTEMGKIILKKLPKFPKKSKNQ